MNPEEPQALSEGAGWAKGLRKHFNALVAFVIKYRITSIIVRNQRTVSEPLGAQFKPGPKGTAVVLTVGGGAVSLLYPFKTTDATTEIDGPRLAILTGDVTDFLNDPVLPTGMSYGNDPLFYLSVGDGDGVAYLDVTVDTDLGSADYGEIQSAHIWSAPAIPSNDYSGGHFYLPLALFVCDGVTVTLLTQQVGGNMGFQLSGEAGLFWSLGPAY